MCHNIAALVGIIGVVRVWCDVMVSAAGINNNGGSCDSSVAGFQNITV